MIIEFRLTYRSKIVYMIFYKLCGDIHDLNPENRSIINSLSPHDTIFWNSVTDYLREKLRRNKKEKVGKSKLR